MPSADAAPIRRNLGEATELRLGTILSVALHLVVALLLLFGIPFLSPPPPPEEVSVPVDLVPLGDVTNPPPPSVKAEKPVAKPQPPKAEPKPEPPKDQPKVEPPKPTPPPPPKPEPPKPPEPPQPPKPAPTPPQPTPPPPPPQADVPAPDKKPEPPKDEPKPQPDQLADVKPRKKPPPPQQDDDFQTLLKTVEKLKQPQQKDDFKQLEKTMQQMEKSEPPPNPNQQEASAADRTVKSEATTFSEHPSASDIDFIRGQIERHWNFDVGARDAASLIVKIHVSLQSDGTVLSADIVADPRYETDSFYRSAADSARRAVLAASPIQIPPGKYEQLKELTLVFDPRNAVR